MKKEIENIENLRKKMHRYADKAGIKLNPDKKKLDWVLNALLKRKEKHGDLYCPCRVITGNKEKDKEIICPCVFHRGEIELQGKCKCELFVSG